MAWPYTPLMTFVDNSTPYVDAAYLNAVQTAINDLSNGKIPGGAPSLRYEEWNYDTSEGTFQNAFLPDHRWKGVVNASFSNNVSFSDSVADFPWSHLVLNTDGASGGYAGVRSAAKILRAHATLHNLLMDGWYGVNATGTGDYKAFWGLSTNATPNPNAAADRYALFYVDEASTTFWKCISGDGTAEQSTTTAIAFPTATTGRARLRIEVVGTSSVKFYIDGALVATHSTRVPSGGDLYAWASLNPATTTTFKPRIGPLLFGSARQS